MFFRYLNIVGLMDFFFPTWFVKRPIGIMFLKSPAVVNQPP